METYDVFFQYVLTASTSTMDIMKYSEILCWLSAWLSGFNELLVHQTLG